MGLEDILGDTEDTAAEAVKADTAEGSESVQVVGVEPVAEAISEQESADVSEGVAVDSDGVSGDTSETNSDASKIVSEAISNVGSINLRSNILEENTEVLRAKEQGLLYCEVYKQGKRIFATYDKNCVPPDDEIYLLLKAGYEVRRLGEKIKKKAFLAKYGEVDDDD